MKKTLPDHPDALDFANSRPTVLNTRVANLKAAYLEVRTLADGMVDQILKLKEKLKRRGG